MDSSGDGLVCSAFVTPDESNIILVVSVLSTGVGNWDLSSNMRP